MKILKKGLIALIIFLFFAFLNYQYISYKSNPYIYNDINKLPENEVGLVLGTSIKNRQGNTNAFFKNRIETAYQLYQSNKINYILVSGDNSTLNYNEPEFMKQALIDKGVPTENIITDYAGFSTLDSVIRAKKVFGQTKLTVISQEFQNQRAIFIARKNQIELIGFNSPTLSFKAAPRVYLREILARLKATVEVNIFNQQPKFLGEPIQI